MYTRTEEIRGNGKGKFSSELARVPRLIGGGGSTGGRDFRGTRSRAFIVN